MTLQQALMNDALPPHTPTPLAADAAATVTGTHIVYLQPGSQTQASIEEAAERDGVCIATCAAPKSISAFVAPKTENQVPGGGLCRLRRMSARRSTRQDAQINYLSTLSIFMKQTTYLATLPNQVPKIRS
jgi:hypothetical protein